MRLQVRGRLRLRRSITLPQVSWEQLRELISDFIEKTPIPKLLESSPSQETHHMLCTVDFICNVVTLL